MHLPLLRAIWIPSFLAFAIPTGSPVISDGCTRNIGRYIDGPIQFSDQYPQLAEHWAVLKRRGVNFTYIEATQAVVNPPDPPRLFVNQAFEKLYKDAGDGGLIRGAMHRGDPRVSTGAEQAGFFLDNGGEWAHSNETLPGVLVLDGSSSNQSDCFQTSPSDIINFIEGFSETYLYKTGRHPVIRTNTEWWLRCTGNTRMFVKNPLWLFSPREYPSLPGPRWSPNFWTMLNGPDSSGALRPVTFQCSSSNLLAFPEGLPTD